VLEEESRYHPVETAGQRKHLAGVPTGWVSANEKDYVDAL
jgi:hypothetical protein